MYGTARGKGAGQIGDRRERKFMRYYDQCGGTDIEGATGRSEDQSDLTGGYKIAIDKNPVNRLYAIMKRALTI